MSCACSAPQTNGPSEAPCCTQDRKPRRTRLKTSISLELTDANEQRQDILSSKALHFFLKSGCNICNPAHRQAKPCIQPRCSVSRRAMWPENFDRTALRLRRPFKGFWLLQTEMSESFGSSPEGKCLGCLCSFTWGSVASHPKGDVSSNLGDMRVSAPPFRFCMSVTFRVSACGFVVLTWPHC